MESEVYSWENKDNNLRENIEVLEQGNIYFFYRIKKRIDEVDGIEDVQRFYMILSSEDKYRLFVIGSKKLPDIEKGSKRKYWGFVYKVSEDAEEVEDEMDSYNGNKPAVPAGEGVYKIVKHDEHTHLIFSLELPKELGKVQEEFNIDKEGNFIISIKNPKYSKAMKNKKARLPEELQEKFDGRSFMYSDTEILDYPFVEILMIESGKDIAKNLGVEIEGEDEDLWKADIFTDLKVERDKHPLNSLFKGRFQVER